MERIERKLAPWYLITCALFTAMLCIVVKLIWSGVSTGLIVISPSVVVLTLYWQERLKLGPEGVAILGAAASWDQLVLHRDRWGDSLRVPAGSAPRAERVVVYLSMFEAGWRRGQIGRAVATWAPHLLDQTDDGR